jgi:hypothetical protein
MENTELNHLVTGEQNPPIVFTRYLYIKDDVFVSLCFSILDKKREETAFWVCELYYSGFEDEVAEYLNKIYHVFFRSRNPLLGKFMESMHGRVYEGAHIAVTMAYNLLAGPRKFTVHDFATRNKDPEIISDSFETRILVTIQPDALEPYQTKVMEPTYNWKFLQQVCLFETRKDAMDIFECSHRTLDSKYICEMHRTDKHWVYFASFSPLWMARILKYKGTIDHAKQTVIFQHDNDLENFFELYGYEPDEQSVIIQRRLMHAVKYKQLSMGEFCRLYDKHALKSVRKVKCA